MISYEVTSLGPLTVRELVCGEGKLVGDIFMRGALEALIKRNIPGYDNSPNLDQVALDREIEKAWGTIRQQRKDTLLSSGWRYVVQTRHRDGSPGQPITVLGYISPRPLALPRNPARLTRSTAGRISSTCSSPSQRTSSLSPRDKWMQ